MADWLKNACFYEIYPQSFKDSNGDGIGDIPGIIEKLGYVKELGCNALWLNPCYDSPFKDAGYDVRDHKKVADRYGTNEDLYRLFSEAHALGMHVILDLVPGHTSEEHEWFKASGKAGRNAYSDRYIWTDFWLSGTPGHPYIGGECERNGTYMLNFFKSQPALNYGFYRPTEAWQMSYEDEAPQETLLAMMDVMRFWLDRGCDGFRVDMADSLVKDDTQKKEGTCSLWRKVRQMLDKEYPQAVLVSEWSNPELAVRNAGFHADFYLDHWGNGYNTLLRDYEPNEVDNSYFKSDGKGDIGRFLKEYIPWLDSVEGKGFVALITCNHDTPRPARTLTGDELKIAYATLLTLPGVPFIYYGDEIGMKYIEGLPTKEGGYTRTGTRTPMQWDRSANCGFSDADKEDLYLPVDEKGPAVADMEKDPYSLLNTVKAVLKIRQSRSEFAADAPFEVLAGEADKPFVFERGDLLVAVNPAKEPKKADIGDRLRGTRAFETLFEIGHGTAVCGTVSMDGGSFAIFERKQTV